jgi:hypothetical protein
MLVVVVAVTVMVKMVKGCVHIWDYVEEEVGTLYVVCNLYKSIINKLD